MRLYCRCIEEGERLWGSSVGISSDAFCGFGTASQHPALPTDLVPPPGHLSGLRITTTPVRREDSTIISSTTRVTAVAPPSVGEMYRGALMPQDGFSMYPHNIGPVGPPASKAHAALACPNLRTPKLSSTRLFTVHFLRPVIVL
jgi:hypothetical protein